MLFLFLYLFVMLLSLFFSLTFVKKFPLVSTRDLPFFTYLHINSHSSFLSCFWHTFAIIYDSHSCWVTSFHTIASFSSLVYFFRQLLHPVWMVFSSFFSQFSFFGYSADALTMSWTDHHTLCEYKCRIYSP